MIKKVFLLLIMLMLISPFSNAQKDWTGSESNDWSNPNNWDPPGVPGKYDVVTIEDNRPACIAPNGIVEVFSLTNQGNLQVNNTMIKTLGFYNNGNLNISNSLIINFTKQESFYNKFENMWNGKITGDNGFLGIYKNKTSDEKCEIKNDGSINLGKITANATEVTNTSNGIIKANSISLTAGTIYNKPNAIIQGKDGPEGGSININSGFISNKGGIYAGTSLQCETGGNVSIYASLSCHNKGTGKIYPGNSLSEYGKCTIRAKKFSNDGKVGPQSRKNGPNAKDTNYGDIAIFAEECIISGDTVKFNCKNFLMVTDQLTLENINNKTIIFAEEQISFYTPQAGSLDFSEVNNLPFISLMVSSGGQQIEIYSDNVLEPLFGLGQLCDPGCTINPANPDIYGADISTTFESSFAGGNGNFELFIQNQSTSEQVINYSISSNQGWVQETTGTTANLAPLAFDSLNVNFSIPVDAGVGTDTIMQIVSVPGQFVDTSYSILDAVLGFDDLEHAEITIPAGWSGFSSYINPIDENLNTLFYNIEDELTIMISDSGVYYPDGNINTLQTWNYQSGHIIKLTDEAAMTFTGGMLIDKTVDLFEGWNIIPVLSENDVNVVDLFAGTDLIIVREVAGNKLNWPQYDIYTLDVLKPGKAYFVKMGSMATLNFE